MAEEGQLRSTYRSSVTVYLFDSTTRHSKCYDGEEQCSRRCSSFLKRYEDYASRDQVLHIYFDEVHCDDKANAHEVANIFPALRYFVWRTSPLPMRFVRELCSAFVGERLVHVVWTKCGLKELPRHLTMLSGLEMLAALDNDIHWVAYELHQHLTHLNILHLSGNPRIPACYHFNSDATLALRQLGQLDARLRATQLCWMGVLRKRRRLARDVVHMLGKMLWSLRGELEH